MYHLCILTSHFYPVKSSCASLFKDLIKSFTLKVGSILPENLLEIENEQIQK